MAIAWQCDFCKGFLSGRPTNPSRTAIAEPGKGRLFKVDIAIRFMYPPVEQDTPQLCKDCLRIIERAAFNPEGA